MQVWVGAALMSVCDGCITHSRTSKWAAGSPQGLEDTRRRFPLGAWSSVNTVHPCWPAVTPVTSEPLAKIHLPLHVVYVAHEALRRAVPLCEAIITNQRWLFPPHTPEVRYLLAGG